MNTTSTNVMGHKRFVATYFLMLLGFFLSMTNVNAQALDIYGGTTAKRFPDGDDDSYFRLAKDPETRHWVFVTPDDNAYLSFGLNHFHANLWYQPGAPAEDGVPAHSGNEDYWETEWGADRQTNPEAWDEAFYAHAKYLTEVINANSLGYHNVERRLTDRDAFVPYIRQFLPLPRLSIHNNPVAEDFFDVFNEFGLDGFRALCQQVIEDSEIDQDKYKNDKMIICYAMQDVLPMTEQHAINVSRFKGYTVPTFARVLRNQGNSPGKRAYIAAMQDRYDSFEDFDDFYETPFNSWFQLRNAENWRPITEEWDANVEGSTNNMSAQEIADNNYFNRQCFGQYYRVASEVFRAADPHHLFVGDKLNAGSRSYWNEFQMIVDTTRHYIDACLYQWYGRADDQFELFDLIRETGDIPMINGDAGFGYDQNIYMNNRQQPTAPDLATRGAWMHEFGLKAFADTSFVGWHICGAIDAWHPGGRNDKPGIIGAQGDLQEPVVAALSNIGKNLYVISGLIESDNFIENGDFSSGDLDPWSFYPGNSSSTAEVTASNEVRINVSNPGQAWEPQIIQTGLTIEQGVEYELVFYARTEDGVEKNLPFSISQRDPFVPVLSEFVTLDSVMRPYIFNFIASTDLNLARLAFSLGVDGVDHEDESVIIPNADVFIDNVILNEIARPNGIVNGDFSGDNINPWSFNSFQLGSVSLRARELAVDITGTSPDSWKPQLIQFGIAIESGKTYQVSIDAKAADERSINLVVRSETNEDRPVFLDENPSLLTQIRRFTYQFTAETGDVNSSFRVNMGDATSTDNVSIDNVSIIEIPSSARFANEAETVEEISTMSNEAILSLTCYPNPTNETLYVEWSEDTYQLSIFNALGQSVYQDLQTSAKSVLDISSFERGIYLVRVSGNGKTLVRRIVIQ